MRRRREGRWGKKDREKETKEKMKMRMSRMMRKRWRKIRTELGIRFMVMISSKRERTEE